jgi:hypothetical protein
MLSATRPIAVFWTNMNAWTPLWSRDQRSWLQNGAVFCFLWGTNWIYVCYVEESRSPLWTTGQSSWLQNGDVLCFLWGANWIYICYEDGTRPPLWSSGHSSWLQNGDVLCFLWGESKNKAIPITGLKGLKSCQMLRIPHSLDNRHRDGGKVVSPTHQPQYTPQKHYYFNIYGTHFC